jgi:hypothetical protein
MYDFVNLFGPEGVVFLELDAENPLVDILGTYRSRISNIASILSVSFFYN